MTSSSSIPNYTNTFAASSSLPLQPPPYLTSAQESAMSAFFERRLARTVNNWNIIPATHSLWERCISILIEEYQERISLPSSAGYIAKKAAEVLTREKNKRDVKRFFCEHLITSRMQMKIELISLIRRMDLNQYARYMCLIPSDPDCIVDCSFKMQETAQAPSIPFEQVTEEISLLLDDTSSHEGNPSVNQIPQKTYISRPHLHVECETSIVLPSRFGYMEKSILKAKKVTLLKKMDKIALEKERQDLERTAAILTTVVVGALVLGYVVLLKK